MRLAVFTVCTNRQVPEARVMLDTVARFLPAATRFLVLADEPHPALAYPAGCTVVPARALGIADFAGFAFRYDEAEFQAALKPFAFLHLAGLGCTHALYFACDTELFGPVPAVTDALAADAPFVLTPQILAPAEAQDPDDVAIMRDGVFNLGFLGVSFTPAARSLLDWWARWLRLHCVDDRSTGLYIDQKFMDLVPGFVPGARILHDPGLNVGAWNLCQRSFVPDAPGGPQAGNGPLGFFRFGGFGDAGTPPALHRFLAGHADRVRAAGDGVAPSYAYGRFASGVPIPSIARRLFRDDREAWAGDPFATFEAWAHLPARDAVLGLGSAMPSLVMQWLQARDPALAGLSLSDPAGAAHVTRRWLERGVAAGMDRRFLEPQALAAGLRPVVAGSFLPDGTGATVVAPFTENGAAGEVGRAQLSSLALAVASVQEAGRDTRPPYPGPGQLLCLCLPTDALAPTLDATPPGAYRVFVPSSERPGIPDSATLARVDEVWAPTRFLQAALVLATDRPVLHMPVAWHFPRPPDRTSAIPRPYILAECDGRPGRGALLAAVRAYGMAFGGRPAAARPALVVSAADDADPALHDAARPLGVVMAPHDPALLAGAACVLALHGGDAIGLPVARAMAWGVPVIATDYGGCTDLLTPDTGYPVEARLVPASHGWTAEADVAHAAWSLRMVFDHPAEAERRVREARHALQAHAPAAVAARQAARLRFLGLESGPFASYRPPP